MKTCRELYEELERWEQYQPTNMTSNIAKQNKIFEIENEIRQEIDVVSNKDIILKITDSEE